MFDDDYIVYMIKVEPSSYFPCKCLVRGFAGQPTPLNKEQIKNENKHLRFFSKLIVHEVWLDSAMGQTKTTPKLRNGELRNAEEPDTHMARDGLVGLRRGV